MGRSQKIRYIGNEFSIARETVGLSLKVFISISGQDYCLLGLVPRYLVGRYWLRQTLAAFLVGIQENHFIFEKEGSILLRKVSTNSTKVTRYHIQETAMLIFTNMRTTGRNIPFALRFEILNPISLNRCDVETSHCSSNGWEYWLPHISCGRSVHPWNTCWGWGSPCRGSGGRRGIPVACHQDTCGRVRHRSS